MARVLVVKSPFGDHQRGSRITDPQEIEKILAGEQAHHVVHADHTDLDKTEEHA